MKNDISIKNYQLNDNLKDYIDCPICYETTNKFYIAECNHSWCNCCNKKILSNLCPLCRKKFKVLPNDDYLDEVIDSQINYLQLRREIIRVRRIIRRRRRRNSFIYKFNELFDYLCCIN